jgi:hypothetical protein
MPSIPPYPLLRDSGQDAVHVSGRDVYLDFDDTPCGNAKYREIVVKVLTDTTKAKMERGAFLHVDISGAELAAKSLPYAETYNTKGGRGNKSGRDHQNPSPRPS